MATEKQRTRLSVFSELIDNAYGEVGEYRLVFDPIPPEDGGFNPGVHFTKSEVQFGAEAGALYEGMIFKAFGRYFLTRNVQYKGARKTPLKFIEIDKTQALRKVRCESALVMA